MSFGSHSIRIYITQNPRGGDIATRPPGVFNLDVYIQLVLANFRLVNKISQFRDICSRNQTLFEYGRTVLLKGASRLARLLPKSPAGRFFR